MDLGGTVTYNGLSLNTVTRQSGGLPMSGYQLERFTADPPPGTAYLEKRANTDGLDAGDVVLGGRAFALVVTAYGTSEGDFWDKTQALIRAFTPTVASAADTANLGFLALDFYQPTANVSSWPVSTYPSGIPMRYYVRPQESPTYALERDRDGGVVGGRSKVFTIRLVARDPRKYAQTAITAAVTTAVSTAVYKGDYNSFGIWSWSQSAAGNSAFVIVTNTFSTVINMSSKTTGTFTFDTAKGTFEDATGTSLWSLITTIDGYSPLQSGSTYYLKNRTGVTADSVSLTYREAFA